MASDKSEEGGDGIKFQAYIDGLDAKGLVAVFPADNELQLDIDTAEQLGRFQRAFGILRETSFPTVSADLPTAVYKRSRNKADGIHITVTLPFEVDAQQRIALQAMLGSDPTRELLAQIALLRGAEVVTVFAEPKPTEEVSL